MITNKSQSNHIDFIAISSLIEEFSEFLGIRIKELKRQKIKEDLDIFLDLLIRFRINIKSIKLILPSFESDIEYKLSLSLLLRTINSDVLTVYYLNSFILAQNQDINGLKNEMKVLYKDYIRFIEEFGKEELELIKENCNYSAG